LALEALNIGADGLIFECSSIPDFKKLLKDIQAEYCSISYKTEASSYELAKAYFNYLISEKVDLSKISGSILTDTLELRDAGVVELAESNFKDLAKLINSIKEVQNFKVANISADLFHNAGANIVHELAFTVSKAVEYFDKLTEEGLSISDIFKHTVFSFAFGRKYFFEIAKIKAFKMIMIKIAKAYDYELNPDDIFIHAEVSKRTKSALDFHVNLLRNTTESMSAILAGCQSLYVAPHDDTKAAEEQKQTFKRIALNLSNILKEEAHLDKITDPTLGSYYIESLIEEIESKSWEVFLSLEKQGSYSELFKLQLVKSFIDQDEKLGSDAALGRKDAFIGANMFQNVGEPLKLKAIPTESSDFLSSKRAAWKIEKLRKRTEDFVLQNGEDSRPKATIILFGTDAVAKAKSDFTYSFLGMAGIKIEEEIFLKDFAKLETVKKNLNSDLIIYCYKEKPDFHEANFKHDNAKIMIAGQEANEEEMCSKGLYACIHRHSEAFSFLNDLLNDLKITL
jgi:methylmalonyl-CoA mutase